MQLVIAVQRLAMVVGKRRSTLSIYQALRGHISASRCSMAESALTIKAECGIRRNAEPK
jgi:hypothetical protein